MITPVILSGGAGKRLWPVSRAAHPKQFLPLFSGSSLFQLTLARVSGNEFNTPLVVCSNDQRFMAREQLGDIAANIIVEPCSRNTAAAVTLAALAVEPESMLLVLPSDHLFTDTAAFRAMVIAAQPLATAGKLVTFGVRPAFAATGYGYIKRAAAVTVDAAHGYVVESFVEKPNKTTAQQYVENNDYLWNCGVFLFRASVLLKEMQQHAPAVYSACSRAYEHRITDLGFTAVSAADFAAAPDISIDYAVMERTQHAVVASCDSPWSDVGSWNSLSDNMEKDEFGNVARGNVMMHSSRNCTVFSEEKLVVTMGLDDLIVVETDDAILVAPRAQSENIKHLVEQMTQEKRPQVQSHRKVYRPWGYYDAIGEGERHKVKRIMVKPGACLSLQMHYHRAEHWIVVRGTAKVTTGETVCLLTENQSTYIPLGVTHRLENPGSMDLELIEVQTGAYLGEDDIVRFQDNYGRG